MISTIWSAVKGLLPSGGSLALYAAAAAMIAGGSAWATHRYYLGVVDDMKLAAAKTQIEAVQQAAASQKAQDDIRLTAAVAEAEAQQKIIVRNVTTVKEVTKYVTDTSTCVTYGLVRVLDAAALGVDPADLELPAGKSNDACAPIASSDLARSVGANYGAALQNAKQLDDLEDTVRKMVAASQGSRDPSLLAGHRQ